MTLTVPAALNQCRSRANKVTEMTSFRLVILQLLTAVTWSSLGYLKPYVSLMRLVLL